MKSDDLLAALHEENSRLMRVHLEDEALAAQLADCRSRAKREVLIRKRVALVKAGLDDFLLRRLEGLDATTDDAEALRQTIAALRSGLQGR